MWTNFDDRFRRVDAVGTSATTDKRTDGKTERLQYSALACIASCTKSDRGYVFIAMQGSCSVLKQLRHTTAGDGDETRSRRRRRRKSLQQYSC